MKRSEFNELWYSQHERQTIGEFEIVDLPANTAKLVGWFDIEDLPIIAVTVLPHGGYFDALSWSPYIELELQSLKDQLIALKEGDIFVIGRAPECDHRWGFAEYINSEYEHIRENAENAYMYMARNVSRIHCILVKENKETVSLYDCSTAGTCIVTKRPVAPEVVQPKKSWWQRIFG